MSTGHGAVAVPGDEIAWVSASSGAHRTASADVAVEIYQIVAWIVARLVSSPVGDRSRPRGVRSDQVASHRLRACHSGPGVAADRVVLHPHVARRLFIKPRWRRKAVELLHPDHVGHGRLTGSIGADVVVAYNDVATARDDARFL